MRSRKAVARSGVAGVRRVLSGKIGNFIGYGRKARGVCLTSPGGRDKPRAGLAFVPLTHSSGLWRSAAQRSPGARCALRTGAVAPKPRGCFAARGSASRTRELRALQCHVGIAPAPLRYAAFF